MELETITLISVLVALVTANLARKANSSAREAFIAQTRRSWAEEYKGSWNFLLMLLNGADFHYAYAGQEERSQAERLIIELMDPEMSYEAAGLARIEILPLSQFLAAAGEALIRGQWRVADAYGVFGSNTARHYAEILWLTHNPHWLPTDWDGSEGAARWTDLGEEGNLFRDQVPEFNTYDQHDCIFVLAMALRAEQCRRGDTYAHFSLQLAGALRQERVGEELKRSLRRATRVRRPNIFGSLRLRWLFHFSARPRLSALFSHDRDPIIDHERIPLVRRRFWESARARDRRVTRAVQKAEES